MEVIPYDVWLALGAPKIPSDILHHFVAINGPLSPDRVAFDILIEHLIRVQLGTIPEEVEELDPRGMLLYPGFDLRRTMDRMPIKDQKDFRLHLAHEPLQESAKYLQS